MASSAIGLNGPIGVQEGRNKIINGEFNLWQRGNTASFGISTGTTSDYTSDRWIYYSKTVAGGTSPSVEVKKATFEFGTEPNSIPVPIHYLKLETGSTGDGFTSGDSQAFIEQRIENVKTFAGQSTTVSFWGRSSNNSRTIQVSAHQFFDGGSAPVHIAGATFGLTNTWTKYDTRLVIPSISGKTLGAGATNDHLALRFNLQSGSSSGYMYDTLMWTQGVTETIELTQVQMEENSKPTQFERLDDESEYQKAERFFEIVPIRAVMYGTSNNSATNHSLTRKRTNDYSIKFVEQGNFVARNPNRGLQSRDKRTDSFTAYVLNHNGSNGDIVPKFTTDYGSGAAGNDLDGYIRVSVDNEIPIGSTGGN